MKKTLKMKKVSVVIVTHNREDYLSKTLQGVFAQNYQNKEVIVVDNRSTDNTEMTVKRFPDVVYVKNKKNYGAAQGKNIGVKASNGEYIWFLDDDVLINDNKCLSKMVKELEADSTIGSIGGSYYSENPGATMHTYIDITGRAIMEIDGRRSTEKNLPEFLITCNCFCRRKLIEEIGLFYPRYFYLAEDKELGYRIIKKGFKNIADPKTAIFHIVANKERLSWARFKFRYHRNRIMFVIRNFGLKKAVMLPLLDLFLIQTKSSDGLFIGYKKLIRSAAQNVLEMPFVALAYLWNVIFLKKILDEKNE